MIYIDTFPGNLFRPQDVIFTFVCCQILIRIPKSISSVVRLSVSGVWGEWVPLSTVCPRQKRGFVPHHKAPQPGMRCGNARPAAPGWTSQVRHRLLSSRSSASSSSWPTQTKGSQAQTSCAELKLEELAPVDLKQNKHDCQQQYLRQYNNCRLLLLKKQLL